MTIRRDLNHKARLSCCAGRLYRTGARGASHYLLSDQNLVWWKKTPETAQLAAGWYNASGEVILTVAPPRRGSLKPLMIMTFLCGGVLFT